MSGVRIAIWLAIGVAFPVATAAKDFGLRSPGRRTIYKDEETFAEVMDQNRRNMVVEVAVGAGPEGNLAMLLGLLNQPIRRMELYVGFGLEANPAHHISGAVRYWFELGGFRPFASLGYVHVDLPEIGTWSHNVFAETGYKWKFHRTYHLTVGVGVRHILDVEVRPDSPLKGPDVDPVFLARELDEVFPWVPTLALRFSRAF